MTAKRIRSTRAVAAVEFAMCLPILLLFLGGGANLGLMVYTRLRLTGAVNAGAEYAALSGSAVNTTTVQGIVQNAGGITGGAGQSLVTATVSGPACYCVSGTSSSLTLQPHTCSQSCPDGTIAASYLTIAATAPYSSIGPSMPYLPQSLSQSVTLRLQ